MEVHWKKNVRVICDLEVGDKVTTDEWGPSLDGKVHTVLKVIQNFGGCESGFMVEITGYDSLIDSGWLNKVPKENG